MDGVERGLEPAVRHLKAQELIDRAGQRSYVKLLRRRREETGNKAKTTYLYSHSAFYRINLVHASVHYVFKVSDKTLAYNIVTQCL